MASKTSVYGFYRWDSSDEIPVTVQQMTDNANNLEGVLTRRYIDVKTLGAKGDYNVTTKTGTSDSTVFQQALDMAKGSTQAVTIYIPSGVYRMTAELKIYANTTIQCAPNVRIVRDHSQYLMMNGFRSTETNPSNAGGYTGQGKLRILGGIWDGNGVNQKQKASIFHLGHANDIIVDGAEFWDVSTSHHIEFNACQNVRVINTGFFGMANVTTEDYNECIQLDLSKTGVTTIGPADNTPCRNVWIENCYFGNSKVSGSGKVGRGVGSHTSTITRPHTNVTIKSCVFEDTLTWGVRSYNWENVSITENTFKNCGMGINHRTAIGGGTQEDIKDPSGTVVGSEIAELVTIANNTFDGGMTAGRAIEVFGESGSNGRAKGVSVTGNTIVSSASANDAIIMHYTDRSTVTGNTIYGAGKTGIYIRESNQITVSGNTVDTSGENGIDVSGVSTYVTVIGNTILRSWKNGVYVGDAGTESVVVSNNVISGANGINGAGNTYNHLRAVSSVNRVVFSGNVCRNYSTTYVTTHALYVTNSCTNVSDTGNVAQGFTWYNAATLTSGSIKDSLGNIHV